MKNQSPTFVRGDGPTTAKYIFVGSQPSVQEIRRSPRKPFSDAGGKELMSYLRTNEIIRSECYFTYVIKSLDYPLPHYLSYNTRKKEMKVSTDADMYMEMLKQELELCSANIIFAVGNEALFALTSRTGITKWRGSILESTLLPGRKVIPIISPKTVIAPNFQFTNRYLIMRDMEKGVKEAEFPELIEHEMQLLIEPSFYRVVEFLLFCIAQGKHGAIIQIDIEVIGEIDCISFAYDEHNCMSIPLVGSKGHYFSIEEEIEIWLLIAQLLEDPDIDQGGQNFIFDLAFIFRKFGIVAHGVSHDTMIAQKMLYPDFRVGLDFITAWYTKLPYYKADGKQWMKFQAGSRHEWWNYNARDSIACAIALPQQLEDLDEIGNQPTYYNKLKIISPLMYMMERGIKVDTAGMLRERDKTEKKIADLNTQIWEIAGKEINTNSPKQLANYFYVDLKHKPYKKRTAKGWVTTTDEIALKRLSRKGVPVAKLVLKIRKLNKRLGTYLNLSKISSDSRARCQYKPHGADTGRLASSEDIFGEGSNQQNWPHDLMSYLVPDTGYIFYSFDLSQIENRIVGYVGNVTHMINAFESKIDLHRKTASLLFDTTIEEVSSEAGSSPFSDERSQRDDGKRCNHSKLAKHTDVLTPVGWLNITDAYIKSLPIAQWDNDKITFVLPTSWHLDTYTGKCCCINNAKIFQSATPEHRMPLLYKDELQIKPIAEYNKSGHHFAPLSGMYSGKVDLPDAAIRLIVAFQADGSWNGNSITVRVFKQRKINRLYDILHDLGIEYSDNKSGIYLSSTLPIVKFIADVLGKQKLFGDWLLQLSGNSLDVFLSELRYWDGAIDGSDRYFTSIKANADWVQTIAHLRNKACHVHQQDNSKNAGAFGNGIIYRCTIRPVTLIATSAITRTVFDVVDEPIICPTVPSGMFLVKEKDKISVTGNSLNYDFGYRSFALRFEMPERDAKWIVEKYHSTYPEVRNNYHKNIQLQLGRTRVITNLKGRKRMFLGKLDDNLYKIAYAHLPQSTVADVMDETIAYIYDNQDLFGPVELLIQIHDSVGFQIPLSIGFAEHARILSLIHAFMCQPLKVKTRSFVVPTDLTIGLNLNKHESLELKNDKMLIPEHDLAIKLEEIHDTLVIEKQEREDSDA